MRRTPRPAGCRPSRGLRLFVNGLLEVGDLTAGRAPRPSTANAPPPAAASRRCWRRRSQLLSGLSHCAGLVVAPKTERPLKHIEFVHLGPGRALVVLVTEDGLVENRIIDVPMGLPASSLIEAVNYLAAGWWAAPWPRRAPP